MQKDYLTDDQVEREIERLQASPLLNPMSKREEVERWQIRKHQ